jgi:hypothetical protein
MAITGLSSFEMWDYTGITQTFISHMTVIFKFHRWERISWGESLSPSQRLGLTLPSVSNVRDLVYNDNGLQKNSAVRQSGIKTGQRNMRSTHCIHCYYISEIKLQRLASWHVQDKCGNTEFMRHSGLKPWSKTTSTGTQLAQNGVQQ